MGTVVLAALLLAGQLLPDWSRLEPVRLRSGLNPIDNIAGDGKPGSISLDWRENGNAWGYDIFMVRAGGSIATVDGEDRFTDRPHTGEDMITSVRFARAPYRGRRTLFALVADRHIVASVPEPSRTTVRVYALVRSEDPIGTPYVFARVGELKPQRRYCHADMALHREIGFPLAASYAGPRTPDGC